MKCLRKIFSIFLIIFCFLQAKALPYYIHSIGIKEGLCQPSAISIWQDKLGRMWFGNIALNCYNGNSTKVIRMSEYFPDIEDVNIHHLCGDDSTLVFIAERTVLTLKLENNHLTRLPIKASGLFLDNEFIYACYSHSIYRYNRITNDVDTILNNDPAIMKEIIPADDKHIWAGTSRGVNLINKENGQKIKTYSPESQIRYIFQDKEKNLWVSTETDSVMFYQPDGKEFIIKDLHTLVSSFVQDSEGLIWIGAITGIYKASIDSQTKLPVILNKEPIQNGSFVMAMYIDKQNMLWSGPYYGDIQYFYTKGPNISVIGVDNNNKDQLHGIILNSITEDSKGNIYIGTRGHGINILDNRLEHVKHLASLNGQLPDDHVYTMYYDNDYESLYLGLHGGHFIYRTDGKQSYTPIKGLASYMMIKCIMPNKEKLIIVTRNDGIFQMDRKTHEISNCFSDKEVLKKCSTNIRTAFIDDQLRLWVSSLEEGLFVVDMNTGKLSKNFGTFKDGFPYIVNGVCGNSDHGIYLSTVNTGLLAFNELNNTFTQYSTENSQFLISNYCFNISMSNFGKLIVTTDQGITVMDISVHKKINGSIHIDNANLAPLNGFSTDCEIYNSPINDNIYLGALNGIFSFKEYRIGVFDDNYDILFSNLKINNELITPEHSLLISKDIAFIKKLTLPYNKNTISLTFASTNFSSTRNTQYEYKLQGHDMLWNKSNNQTITYTSLRPGDYTLIVREVGNTQKLKTIDITIKAPLWGSWIAFLFYFIVLGIIVFFIYRFFKSKRLLRESLEKEKKEKEQIEAISKGKVQFMTELSNDIRSPLTILTASLDSIANDNNITGKRKIQKVIKQISHIEQLIAQLLDFSMIEEKKLTSSSTETLQFDENDKDIISDSLHYKILIIEKDNEFRTFLKEHFSFAYSVIECGSGEEGLNIAINEQPDLIICENSLDGTSGIELCKIIKTNLETLHIPFIILSSKPSDELKKQIVRAGADDYFIKPFEMELLLQRCNYLISNRRDILQTLTQRYEESTIPITTSQQNQLFLDKNIEILEKHLGEPNFDILTWSKELGIGRTSLFNQFKECTGMTPNDYLLQYKIKKAQILLKDYKLSISDIAYQLGYSDPAYFSRNFKKNTGISPQQFRKKSSSE